MYPKGYRGFESLSLRHAVCTAEKTACNSCEIARLGRNCANLSRKADRRKCPAQSCRQAFAPFSLGGIRAVRFQGLYQANALRSQTGALKLLQKGEDSAKATPPSSCA